MAMETMPMTEIIPSGPGAIQVATEDGVDWLPAEVSLHFEIVGEQEGTDTIALLELEAQAVTYGHEAVMQRIQIELTAGDLVALMNDAIHEAHNQYQLRDRD